MDYGEPEPTSPDGGERPQKSRRRPAYKVIAATWLTGGVFLLAMGGFVWWQTSADDKPASWVYVDPNVRTVGDDLVAGASSGPAPLGERQYNLRIEGIEVDAPVSPFNAGDSGAPQLPQEGDIVAWYTFTAKPGNGGNAVYCAHGAWNGADGVFVRLAELQPDDRFSFVNDDGARLTYKVIESRPVDSNAVALQSWFAPTTYDAATLMTCDEPWYVETAAEGGPASSYVVRGSLVEVKTAD